jgi:hypothetical protein
MVTQILISAAIRVPFHDHGGSTGHMVRCSEELRDVGVFKSVPDIHFAIETLLLWLDPTDDLKREIKRKTNPLEPSII